jgi:ATP-binding cassette, subfamily B, bacterial
MEPVATASADLPKGGGSSLAMPGALLLARRDEEDEPRELPLDYGLIRRIFAFTGRHATKRNVLFALTIIRSIQLPLITAALSWVISGPIANGDLPGVWQGVVVFAALVLLTDVMFHFRQRLALELGEAVVLDLRRDLFAHLQRLPMSFYNRTKLGRIISRMTSDIESIRVGVRDVFFVCTVQIGQLTVAAILMLYRDWALFCVILGMAPVLWLINRHFRRSLSTSLRVVQESFSRVTSTIAESVSGMRVTQGFAREATNAGLFRRLLNDHARYNMDVARNSALLTPMLELNSQFFIALLLLLGGWRALQPDATTTVGDLVTFFFLANQFFSPILALGGQYNNALTAMAGAERVFKLLDRKPEWEDAPTAQDLPDPRVGVPNAKCQLPNAPAEKGIERSTIRNSALGTSHPLPDAPHSPTGASVEFRHVTFAYEPGRPVLHDVSFEAHPGQTVALVGHTGSGKSSIINLVSKFYLPTSGEVLIDGVEIRRIRSESLHRQMGIVLQQNFLFTGSVLDNIRFARPEASDAEVIAAVRALDCLDVIGELSNGLGTVVGERGAGISIGQRQLVCFARAMLANPRLLILDEATSAIDTFTEARLQRALDHLLRGRTAFVVAHRLSTIRNSDTLLVLDQGRIVERGRHEDLLALNGVYATLHRQFTAAGDSHLRPTPPAA